MKKLFRTSETNKQLWQFFLLTFTLSWLAWVPLAVSGQDVSVNADNFSLTSFLVAGAFSPSVVGIWMTYQAEDEAGRRDFWRRVVDFRRIGLGWLLFILLVFPATMTLTFVLDLLLGGKPPGLEGSIEILTNPSALIFFLSTMLVVGPVSEEIGWRGFALDKLLDTWPPLSASLFLGLVHSLWHLPLFFTKGTSQGAMGAGSMLFWLFVVQVMAGAVLFTGVYLSTQRSILSAIWIHFISNATFTFVSMLGSALPERTEIIRTMVLILTAALFVMLSKPWKERLLLTPNNI